MRYSIAAACLSLGLIFTSTASVAADQKYEARVVANWTSTETFDYDQSSANEHNTAKGTITIKSSYSGNFQVFSSNGEVSIAKAIGPKPSSSVSATVTGQGSQANATGQPITETENFASSYQNPNFDKPATGTGSASATNLDEWATNGSGLGFRFQTDAVLKGLCTISTIPGPGSCPPLVFQHSGNSGDGTTNDSSDKQVAPQTLTIHQTFDATSKAAEATLPALAFLAPWSGQKANGSLNQGYKFTLAGTRQSTVGQGKLNWTVTGSVVVTILNKLKS
jgi:hypothetical protein